MTTDLVMIPTSRTIATPMALMDMDPMDRQLTFWAEWAASAVAVVGVGTTKAPTTSRIMEDENTISIRPAILVSYGVVTSTDSMLLFESSLQLAAAEV